MDGLFVAELAGLYRVVFAGTVACAAAMVADVLSEASVAETTGLCGAMFASAICTVMAAAALGVVLVAEIASLRGAAFACASVGIATALGAAFVVEFRGVLRVALVCDVVCVAVADALVCVSLPALERNLFCAAATASVVPVAVSADELAGSPGFTLAEGFACAGAKAACEFIAV